MLTSYQDDEALFNAIMAGASGYLLKQVRGTDLVEAIRTVAAGGSLLDPAVTQRVLERIRTGGEREAPGAGPPAAPGGGHPQPGAAGGPDPQDRAPEVPPPENGEKK